MEVRASELLGYLGSFIGLLTVAQTMLHNLLPTPLMGVVAGLMCRAQNALSRFHYVEVPEYDESCLPNELYGAIKLHLSVSITRTSVLSAKRLKLYCAANARDFTWSPGHHELLPITFLGSNLFWEHFTAPEQSSPQHQMHATLWNRPPLPDEKRSFILKLHKKDKNRVLKPYMEHILKQAREIRHKNRERLLYTNGRNDSFRHPWDSVPFKHPSTFETLALDPVKKRQIEEDLQAFAMGEEFYRRTGRAWKRGYLLYGPPGTGKSSLIAAMANLLRYDVYDLELTQVRSNAELRKLLLRTTSKSIIVIEDIDCSLELGSRAGSSTRLSRAPTLGIRRSTTSMDSHSFGGGLKGGVESGRGGGLDECALMQSSPSSSCSSMTLSGLLNFTDGLWSCCGDERIFVFTTNQIESLDPALLRSGRMDMHIFMSHCTFEAFKILAFNYLGIKDHPLFAEIEEAMDCAQMTPAEVSEILIRYRSKAEVAIKEVVVELHKQAEKGNVVCGSVKSAVLPPTPVKEEELDGTCNHNVGLLLAKPWVPCMMDNPVVVKEELCVHSIEEEVEQVKRAVQDSSIDELSLRTKKKSDVPGDNLLPKSIQCPNCKHAIPHDQEAGFLSSSNNKDLIFGDHDEEILPYRHINAGQLMKLQKAD
ncbi:hypothetical protein GOP47_0000961 [Adiantum capillus-veneris]|uniref:AAA+ ATPase domain-containing protein n=1 Tax=Adiantum capillus-veneris TaxID=13818 RepID=A0A9D4VG49_ADICA|nr:hypothetical protein GOP47_0000961 [Adiantum capillus-veneris]